MNWKTILGIGLIEILIGIISGFFTYKLIFPFGSLIMLVSGVFLVIMAGRERTTLEVRK